MKKLFVCLCAGVLLAGCGSGASKEKSTKTCTLEASGMKSSFIFEAEGDTVTKATFEIIAGYDLMGVTYEDVKDADEATLKAAQDLILKEADMTEDDADVKTEVTEEGLKFTMAVEASDMEKTFNATSVDEMEKEMTDQGFTCK